MERFLVVGGLDVAEDFEILGAGRVGHERFGLGRLLLGHDASPGWGSCGWRDPRVAPQRRTVTSAPRRSSRQFCGKRQEFFRVFVVGRCGRAREDNGQAPAKMAARVNSWAPVRVPYGDPVLS